MDGPAHYRKAEHVLAQVEDRDVSAAMVAAFTAVAQVHATLALAAATALPGQHPGDWEREIWAFGPGPGESDVTP
jgi:hypothetical protein